MSAMITGIVTNGLVVPATPLPEGARVEIHYEPVCVPMPYLNATELRKLPPKEREPYLAAAAELAEPYYRDDKELTGFDAFSDELNDEDYDDLN